MEELKKLVPYITYYEEGDPVKCKFNLSNHQLTFETDVELEGDAELYLVFYLMEDENEEDGFNFNHLLQEINKMEGKQSSVEEKDYLYKKGLSFSEEEKELVLKMMYYILTENAYFRFKGDNDIKHDEFYWLLLDLLTDDNPYLPHIAAKHQQNQSD